MMDMVEDHTKHPTDLERGSDSKLRKGNKQAEKNRKTWKQANTAKLEIATRTSANLGNRVIF